jgi:hypothetical protein
VETWGGKGEAIIDARGVGAAGPSDDVGCDAVNGDEGDVEGMQKTRGATSQRSRCLRRKKNGILSCLQQEAQAAADAAVEVVWAALEEEEEEEEEEGGTGA